MIGTVIGPTPHAIASCRHQIDQFQFGWEDGISITTLIKVPYSGTPILLPPPGGHGHLTVPFATAGVQYHACMAHGRRVMSGESE